MATTAADPQDCLERIVGNGCLATGELWVLVDHGDGTFEFLAAETGLPADPADRVDCPGPVEITTRETLRLLNPWTTGAAINGLGTLVAWEVRAARLPVTIDINGVAFAMDLNEVLGVRAQDNRVLTDAIAVTISGVGRAEIMSTRRFLP